MKNEFKCIQCSSTNIVQRAYLKTPNMFTFHYLCDKHKISETLLQLNSCVYNNIEKISNEEIHKLEEQLGIPLKDRVAAAPIDKTQPDPKIKTLTYLLSSDQMKTYKVGHYGVLNIKPLDSAHAAYIILFESGRQKIVRSNIMITDTE